MRIGAVLSPVADWAQVVDGARAADEAGLDAIGLWDHYHSARPEWAYVCGWSAYGALAAATRHVRLVPMVLNNLHYEFGVLAKESSILSLVSDGRFELGLGGGDWPASFAAWGRDFPARERRVQLLEETIEAIKLVWTGQPVNYRGRHIQLDGATCTPVPSQPPRIVVGVGKSGYLAARVASAVDELNVYDDEAIVDAALRARTETGVSVSLFVSWEWDKWPRDVDRALASISARGVDRVFVSIGGADMRDRIAALARAAQVVA